MRSGRIPARKQYCGRETAISENVESAATVAAFGCSQGGEHFVVELQAVDCCYDLFWACNKSPIGSRQVARSHMPIVSDDGVKRKPLERWVRYDGREWSGRPPRSGESDLL